MDPFAALFRADHDEDDDKKPAPLPEAQIMTLREIAEAYVRPCPFKPGDLVTPAPWCDLRGKGTPHVVLEVIERPEPRWGEAFSGRDGARTDMRVASYSEKGAYALYWVESLAFVPYTGEGA